jgi:hypothetical protein
MGNPEPNVDPEAQHRAVAAPLDEQGADPTQDITRGAGKPPPEPVRERISPDAQTHGRGVEEHAVPNAALGRPEA